MKILIVMIGGFLGSIARFSLGEWVHTGNNFPYGTLLINLFGCFLLGWLLTYTAIKKNKISPEVTLLFGTGLIGSLTTFSTFSVETIQLFNQGLTIFAFLYVLSSTCLGLLFAYIGYKLATLMNNSEGGTI